MRPRCQIEGCYGHVRSLGLCQRHYMQHRRSHGKSLWRQTGGGAQSTREHLEATRTVLLERGWKQGGRDEAPKTGPVCLMNAVRLARRPGASPDLDGARDAIKAVAGCRLVTVWQDVPGRTFAQVLRVLDLAIKAAT